MTIGNALVEEKLYTVGEVARLLRVDGTTVRRWIVTGLWKEGIIFLPSSGYRTSYRIRESAINALVEQASK